MDYQRTWAILGGENNRSVPFYLGLEVDLILLAISFQAHLGDNSFSFLIWHIIHLDGYIIQHCR
jgi:hypothetical protein